jgi:hypothetical protein
MLEFRGVLADFHDRDASFAIGSNLLLQLIGSLKSSSSSVVVLTTS